MHCMFIRIPMTYSITWKDLTTPEKRGDPPCCCLFIHLAAEYAAALTSSYTVASTLGLHGSVPHRVARKFHSGVRSQTLRGCPLDTALSCALARSQHKRCVLLSQCCSVNEGSGSSNQNLAQRRTKTLHTVPLIMNNITHLHRHKVNHFTD